MNYSDEELKAMTKWSEENTSDETIYPTKEQQDAAANKESMLPDATLLHDGGLKNLAQLFSQGYRVAAYVMSSETRAEIDAWIEANPDRNPPFGSAPTEIDESVESIQVRLKEPGIDVTNNDEILEAMKELAPNMPKMDPYKPGADHE